MNVTRGRHGDPWVIVKVEGVRRGWYVLCKRLVVSAAASALRATALLGEAMGWKASRSAHTGPLAAFLSRSSHARRSASGVLVPWAKKWHAWQSVKRFSGKSLPPAATGVRW